jgi:hypothetical protein
MPKITWGVALSASGALIPWTHVQAGATTLKFSGRPGPLLLEAVEAAEQIEADRLARLAVASAADPRD